MEQLLDSLRQQLLTRTDARETDGLSSSTAQADIANAQRAETTEDLRKRIARELGPLDLSTTMGRRRARISFIESIIAWDFGNSMVRDPQFSAFVQSIEESMSKDSQTSELLDEMLSAMAKGGSA